jgi:hypothetical protein
VTDLLEIALHEISLVLNPANPGARVLAVKTDDERDLEVVELADEFTRRDLEPVRREWAAAMSRLSVPTTPLDSAQKAERLAREHAPIRIASFEC